MTVVRSRFHQLLAQLSAILYLAIQAHVQCDGRFNGLFNKTEGDALLKFKEGLKDPSNRLSSWTPGKDCCQWEGVVCNRTTGHVISLDLHTQDSLLKLSGELKSSLLDLPYLSYLDLSGNDFWQTKVPEFIGSCPNLQHLNLAGTKIRGTLPDQLGNLSHLQSLNLSGNEFRLSVNNLNWLSSLSSLKVLDFSEVLLEKAWNWLDVINMLPSLEVLRLSKCRLQTLPLHLAHVNITSLKVLDLSYNNFTTKMPDWLFEIGPSLQYLNLTESKLYGRIPDKFENLKSLAILDLSNNNLSGPIPTTLGQTHSQNKLGIRSSLRELHLSHNYLSGRLEKRLEQLAELIVLNVAYNELEGVISDAHLSNFSSLRVLRLSSNYLKLHASKNWTPPFNLETIDLGSVELGPQFPSWIQSQNNFSYIDLSDAMISGSVPDWFWNLSPRVEHMDLYNNTLSGCGLDFSSNMKLEVLDLSENNFSCSLPLFYPSINFVDLSGNSFSGSMSHLCGVLGVKSSLGFLDLSDNHLSGNIPDCWAKGSSLEVLELSKNLFTGNIPDSFGNLDRLIWLDLGSNNLSGQIPMSLQNCVNLILLNVAENKLSGNIPTWMGERLLYLVLLGFRSNLFEGIIPLQLCQLRLVFRLDLSQNHLTGSIPPCLSDAMNLNRMESDSFDPYNRVHLYETKEGSRTLTILSSSGTFRFHSGSNKLDLSSNELNGTIPKEITQASELRELNLSRNQLVGSIPSNIGDLEDLEVLDLSRNQLSCAIPASMADISRLSALDLSYNTLSGEIPSGHVLQSFNKSSYQGNPQLCGRQLEKACMTSDPHCDDSEGNKERDGNHEDNGDGLEMSAFCISMGIGFFTAYSVFWGSLFFIPSWRYAYFRFLSNTNDCIYVTVAVAVSKLRRKFQSQQVPR